MYQGMMLSAIRVNYCISLSLLILQWENLPRQSLRSCIVLTSLNVQTYQTHGYFLSEDEMSLRDYCHISIDKNLVVLAVCFGFCKCADW